MLIFRVAARLGIPVSELEWRITHTELVEWAVFFELELKQHDKQDYYLAQIAAMLSGAKKTKITDFLIKFGQPHKKPMKLKPEDQQKIFMKLFGIKQNTP